MQRLLYFPIFAVLASILAFYQPHLFVDFKSWIVPLLTLVMLSMGLQLSAVDFKKIWHYRHLVLLGVGLQFLIMPLAAWILSTFVGLSEALLIGMILVGATAGGTASNVITFLAKGNVALSVSMTVVSTLASVILLPFLSWLYLHQSIDLPVLGMLKMLFIMIILPVTFGVVLHHFFSAQLEKFKELTSQFAMTVIIFIIAIVVALNQANLSEVAFVLVIVVVLHNLIGMSSGYYLAKWLGYDSYIARTVAIEVGMQNSGLSVALALKFFSPAAALPGALFSLWHNISGMLFALFWVHRQSKKS